MHGQYKINKKFITKEFSFFIYWIKEFPYGRRPQNEFVCWHMYNKINFTKILYKYTTTRHNFCEQGLVHAHRIAPL